MPPIKILLLGFSFLLLSACGGGGGGGDGESVKTGQFIDSAVSGIRYETATRTGVTNSEGQFEYLAGETVRFYIGEQLLGDAQGAPRVTLFDLVEGVTPVVGNALVDAVWNWKSGPGFSTVINLATLLQTLDSDGDPDNGIAVTADIAALFAANSVDFDQHWQDFSRDSGFRHVLAEAKANALLDENRQIRAPWRAMDHLYTSLGIDSNLSVRTSSSETSVFGGDHYANRWEFDAEGRVTRVESTSFWNPYYGEAHSFSTFAYDANGNRVRQESGNDWSGAPVHVTIYYYNPTGDLIRIERDSNFDGSPNSITTYAYDANGNRTRAEDDYNTDGMPDEITTYAFDANGNLVREKYDSDGSEVTPAGVTNYAYDANDNLIRTEEDLDGDGTLDSIYSSSYDDDSNLLRYAYDSDGDGNLDRIESYTYDDNDNLIREEYDVSGDGSLNRIYTYTYDDAGMLTQEDRDNDGDGISDGGRTYTYDSSGNLQRTVGTNPGSLIEEFTYDAYNNLVNREAYYDDGLNTPSHYGRYTWDPNVDGWWAIFNL